MQNLYPFLVRNFDLHAKRVGYHGSINTFEIGSSGDDAVFGIVLTLQKVSELRRRFHRVAMCVPESGDVLDLTVGKYSGPVHVNCPRLPEIKYEIVKKMY